MTRCAGTRACFVVLKSRLAAAPYRHQHHLTPPITLPPTPPPRAVFIWFAAGLAGVIFSANIGSENRTAGASAPAFALAGALLRGPDRLSHAACRAQLRSSRCRLRP